MTNATDGEQRTHQRDPVGVEVTEAQLLHKLRARQQQEVKVEEVLELIVEHLATQEKEDVHSQIFAVWHIV